MESNKKQKTSSFTINLNENDENNSHKNVTNVTENKSLEYILKRNETLDNENRELRKEIEELRKKCEEEEDFNDKNDSRLSNMKGLTKNVVEAKKICEDIRSFSKNNHSNYKKVIEERENFSKQLYQIMYGESLIVTVFMLFVALKISFMYLVTISAIIFTTITYGVKTYKKNKEISEEIIKMLYIEILKLNDKIRDKEVQLGKLKNATDFLYDHIDGI